MLGSRAYFALLRRNALYRKRNIFGTLFEIVLPVGFICILLAIKISLEDTDGFKPEVEPPRFPTNSDAVIPLTFRDYVTSVRAERTCSSFDGEKYISGALSSQNPFLKCDGRSCPDGVDGVNAETRCEYLILAVAPKSSSGVRAKTHVTNFVDYTLNKYAEYNSTGHYKYPMVQNFTDEQAIADYIAASDYESAAKPKIAFAVIFDEGTSGNDYAYSLRMNSTNFNIPENEGRPATTTTPPTNRLFSNFAVEDNICELVGGTAEQMPGRDSSCTYQYMFNGGIAIQRLVNDWILSDTGSADVGYNVAEHGVQFVPFPSKEFTRNGFYAQINPFAPLLILLGLLYPVAAMIRGITLEKQLRQKELMKMMTVTESDIGWSWFSSFFLFHIITTICMTAACVELYENSEGALLFVFWLFGLTSVIVFSMVLSAPFSKAPNATLVGLIVFFMGYFLTLAADFETGSSSTISAVSLHPIAAIAYGMQEIGRLEDAGAGVTFDTFNSTDSPSGFTFVNSIQSFIFDMIFWGIISWYLNRVIKADFGQPLPWYFPFTGSYWCPGSGKALAHDEEEVANDENVPIEPVTDALKAQSSEGLGIEIRGLRKRFGEKTAVDGLNLSMYSGQVTALLGHNGAGKTTTISMLTGMLAPTEGYALVGGKDIRTQMSQIRQEIGICLQHDCLFPQLTVEEHVQFFARLKGLYSKYSRKEANEKIKQSIEDVALLEKRHTLSKNLSGGMKRKLSVAIAFCGDSKTVLLDEPTSGMDPFSRRFTWNVIRQYRQDRCIILTTHFMDEADILGDRIAIMAEGQLRCAGSSLFLKRQYGVGYQLTIEKQPLTGKTKEVTGGGGGGGEVEVVSEGVDSRLEDIVTGSVAEANLLSNVGTEMSFQLPIGAASSFTPMFEQLDKEVEDGEIVTYGVGITTLDEVFLLVARGETGEKKSLKSSMHAGGEMTFEDDKSARSQMDLHDHGLFTRHLSSLLRKRALNFKRDKKAWVCSTVLPSFFVFLGFLVFKFAAPARNLDPLTMSLADYNVDVSSTPRNPIPVNAAGNSFTCQTGSCLAQDGTSGLDFFIKSVTGQEPIGVDQAYCGEGWFATGTDECTISESENVMSTVTEDGAVAIPLSGVNTVSESSIRLFNTSSDYPASQYGAVMFTHDASTTIVGGNTTYADYVVSQCENFVASSSPPLLNASMCSDYVGVGYLVNYNFTAVHGALLFQGLADEGLLRQAQNDNSYTITTTVHPLPITTRENAFGQAQDAFFAWLLVVLSFPFISGSFGTFIVTEKANKAKHLQTVAGVQPAAYWLSSYLWDVINYQLPCWITVILMFAFSVDTLTTTDRGVVGGVIVTLLLFGPASAGFTYCITFLFSSASMCNLFIILFNFLIGLAGPMVSFILRLIGDPSASDNASLITAANIIDWVLRFIPSFNLCSGLFKIINVETFVVIERKNLTVWDDKVILFETIMQCIWCFFYLFLAILLDYGATNPSVVAMYKKVIRVITFRCFSKGQISESASPAFISDEDVLAEQERVLTGGANDDLIVLNQMTKQYDNGKVAVNHMSLGIPPGQCFGLLGINGAGKTTTMGMLTAEFPPTAGDATLAGYSVKNQPEKTRRRIGYCPQFDAHFQNMTGREHVALYAAIKGVPSELVNSAVEKKLEEVGLSEFDSNRLSAGYSGGMKRKLSVACATIGQPQIVFLDEPSTGMDPVARRDMWEVISEMVSGGNVLPEERTSVILTTHSMEECEALCPRIGIMANGKLRCLGSAQHLKSRFGQGYQVEMKVKVVSHDDEDYKETLVNIAKSAGKPLDENVEEGLGHDIFLSLAEAKTALTSLTNDESLADKVSSHDPTGYVIYKNASSAVGCTLEELASFAVSEIRMTNVEKFFQDNFKVYILRERQDNKARYEVGSSGVKISTIFAKIEEEKESLMVADYGVSQTSLEQVFNMHAAEAEKLKHGRSDG